MSKKLVSVFVASSLIMVAIAHAEGSAPVYDADNYPPQFDQQADAQEEGSGSLPPPQEQQSVVLPTTSLNASQRIARLEQRLNNLQNSESNRRVSSLQNEVQVLRGQVEELTHQLQEVQTQQKAIYSDLDKKLAQQSISKQASSPTQLEEINRQSQQLQAKQHNLATKIGKRSKQEPAELTDKDEVKKVDPMVAVNTKEQQIKQKKVVATVDKSDTQPNAEEEQQIYQNAYNYIKEKKYAEAVATLKSMLHKYPSGQFAANAHYWLGELYGLLNNTTESANEFSTVIKSYPDSPKISDAQLKLGMIQASQLKWKEAKAAFKRVMSQYPGTTSAKMASEQLKQIRLAGH